MQIQEEKIALIVFAELQILKLLQRADRTYRLWNWFFQGMLTVVKNAIDTLRIVSFLAMK